MRDNLDDKTIGAEKTKKRELVIDLNKIISKNWHYIVTFFFGAILSVGVWAMMTQIMTGDDYAFHVTRMQSASRAWSNGQFLPQVDPDALNGFGYAYNLFYGPLVTYLAAGLQVVFNFWPIAINLILVICLIGGGLMMCRTMTKISQNKVIAVLTAVFYMSAPYAINNLYSRMAMGEVVAFFGAPILLLGLYQLTNHEKHASRNLAIAAAFLILSHSLSAMLFALAAVVYVILNIKQLFNVESIWRMILAVLVALGLTAFFTLPMIEAKVQGNYGVFDTGYADVYFGANARSMNDHRIWPQQLLVINYAGGVNADGLGGEFGVTLGIISIIGLVGYWFARRVIDDKKQRKFVSSLYFIAVLAILLSLPVINWYYMPGILWQMQFPWRTLMVAMVALAVVSGYTLYALIQGMAKNKQKIAAVALSMLAVYFVMPLVLPRAERHIDEETVKNDPVVLGWEAEYAPMQLLCSPDKEEDTSQGFACSLGRVRDLLAKRGDGLKVLGGDGEILNAVKDGLKVDFEISNENNQSTLVELPLIWYPGYQAIMDGEELMVGASEQYGLVEVTIPAHRRGKVEVRYGVSMATKVGLMISGGTLGLSMIWVICTGIHDFYRNRKKAEVDKFMGSVRKAMKENEEGDGGLMETLGIDEDMGEDEDYDLEDVTEALEAAKKEEEVVDSEVKGGKSETGTKDTKVVGSTVSAKSSKKKSSSTKKTKKTTIKTKNTASESSDVKPKITRVKASSRKEA